MTPHTLIRSGLILATACTLSACGMSDRLANVGKAPDMSPIANPQTQKGYQPVSMPMPAPQVAYKQPNSLWQSDRKGFFKDQRASNIGDILTVMIEIKDKAELDNETSRTRSGEEGTGISELLGYEARLVDLFPDTIDPNFPVGFSSESTHNGSGEIDREEKIQVKLAALITQVMPNGNLAISGSQEVRVNFEKRILNVAGVIRPEDITVDNTISYEKIAEARISYGGEGQITDAQQPRYGQQIYDIVFPF